MVHLFTQSGGKLRFNEKKHYFFTKKSRFNQISVGLVMEFWIKKYYSKYQEKTKSFLNIKETEQFNVLEPQKKF